MVLSDGANNLHMSGKLNMDFHLHKVVAHGLQRISNESLERAAYTTWLHIDFNSPVPQGPPVESGIS